MKKIYDTQISQLDLVSEIEIMGLYSKGSTFWMPISDTPESRGFHTKLEDIFTPDIVGMINTLS